VIRRFAAPWVLTGAPGPEGVLRDGGLALQGDRIVAVGPRAKIEAQFGPAERIEGVILPALVNAHLHVELSHLRGRVPGGGGLAAWVERLVAERKRPGAGDEAIAVAVDELRAAGVAAVGDVTNTLSSLGALGWKGFTGTLFHEVYGWSEERIEAARSQARAVREAAPTGPTGLAVVESPHAVYSTHPSLVRRLLQAGPASIHLAEDPGERRFCAEAEGPFAEIAWQLGATELRPMARSAVALVAPFLGPRSLVVHVVDLDDGDRALLARSGATAVLCPRSNLHIGGALPDLPKLLDAGVSLAVGTDSLASSPSLSPLAELAALRRAWPELSPLRLLALAWNGRCVGASNVGRLAPGRVPGVIAAPFDAASPEDPAAWLLDAVGAEERPLVWIAQNRPELSA
jgi:cytosine/adenosine deaminase-related metal-dependent hydrolase